MGFSRTWTKFVGPLIPDSMENAFGEEVSRRTQRGLSTAFCYDSFGRLTGLYEENGASQGPNSIAATLWNYGENAPLKGLLTSVTHPNQTVSYNYDTCQRVVGETVQIQGGGVYTTQYTYDGASRTASVTYPSGVVTNYTYNAIGYQRMQTDASGQVLYKTNRTNPLGQMERFTLGNGMVSSLEYDPETHLLAAIRTKKGGLDIQNLLLDYDGFCNLAARKDNLRNMEERFTYTDTYARPMFDRGFTGHEHLYAFGLINMNGRMYDPVMSSFLSVDRYIQSPGNDQDFNRYAYCMYNPLRYVDPTGWVFTSSHGSPPRSVSGLIQDYLSDPCYITRQQLRDAGIYCVEGGYGYVGGSGSMGAHWMEGFGIGHYTSWDIQTDNSGFEAGAWAIPDSFYPMWINYCQGLCNYGSYGCVNENNNYNSIVSTRNEGNIINNLYNWFYAGVQKTSNYFKRKNEYLNYNLGSIIASFAGCDFNKKMFWNYWNGLGDYSLSINEFEDIVSLSQPNGKPFNSEWNGDFAIALPVTLYGTKYDNALGTTTIFYDLDGNAIGIHELYDFNFFPIRKSWSAQIKTALVLRAGLYNENNKSFYINYNYHP